MKLKYNNFFLAVLSIPKQFYEAINRQNLFIKMELTRRMKLGRFASSSIPYANKPALLCLCIVLCFSGVGIGQNIDSLLIRQNAIAMELQSTGKFYDAVTEYERLLYFDVNKKYSFEANFRMGQCYRAGARLSDASKAFSRAILSAPDNRSGDSARIELIKIVILRRDLGTALAMIHQYEASSKNTAIARYWRGWAYVMMDDWERAVNCFGSPDTTEFLRDFCVSVKNQKFSIEKAKIFSALLPGLGQFYTGEYIQGSISFGWNVLFGYLTVKSFLADRVFDGFAVGSLLWMRFYGGGQEAAEHYANEKNTEIFTKSLLFLEYEYKGIKL